MAEKKKAKKFGKIVQLPKDTNVVNFMEKIKIPKKDLWYIMTEKEDENSDTELHVIKYNQEVEEAVDTTQFIAQVKEFYMKSATDEKTKKLFESIRIVGNDKFTFIKNIPDIEIENGQKLVTKLTSDILRLLK